LHSTLKSLCHNELKASIDQFNAGQPKKANLVVAHDTRASCALLLEGFKTGAELLQANVVNFGLLTTPQLHYMVRCLNTNGGYGEPSEEGYYNKISQAFFNVWSMVIIIMIDWICFFFNLKYEA
jgi:phosphoacetylglucosamine mutase